MKSSTLLPWLNKRGAGVLLHPTSFPGDTGIGTFGVDAINFIEFLRASGISYWQLCSLGPTGYGDSPYQCFSAFAGNPYLIDLDSLIPHGFLKSNDLNDLRQLPEDNVNYGRQYYLRWPVLRLAFKRFWSSGASVSEYGNYNKFKKEHAEWLYPFACFMALKGHFKGQSWVDWGPSYCSYEKAKNSDLVKKIDEKIEAHLFFQYLFYGQWGQLKKYANQNGIQVIGDLPLYVSLDSADVWAQPELFKLDKMHRPTSVAGVPPDYFSPTGQLWGNPLYNWNYLKSNAYSWWMDRLGHNFKLYDIVRLDHFRGFESYWEIPIGSKDARKGKWTRGPGINFFTQLKKQFPKAQLIAEDLGIITPKVRELLAKTGLPGMCVLQYAFEDNDANNLYLPHNVNANSFFYSGTHDNDTIWGWYRSASKEVKHRVRQYLGVPGDDIAWDFVRASYCSVSRIAIIPMQDLLNLGTKSRMNTPGRTFGNWQWRYTREAISNLRHNSASYLKELGAIYGRIQVPPSIPKKKISN